MYMQESMKRRGEWWDTGTPEEYFLGKYPASEGEFYLDIIAGHVSTSSLKGDRTFHGLRFVAYRI